MTPRAGDRSAGYPAPGSAVPGAPPPLKRALTAADGLPDPVGTPATQHVSGSDGVPPDAAHRPGAGLQAAAAMFGVAVGLELVTQWSRIAAGRRVTKRVRC